MKRGISIKLGYADADFYKIKLKNGDEHYTSEPNKDIFKGGKKELIRTVSFVDAPGHETLMAVMLSGAAIMDAAILIIAANEKCPQPQTREHLSALEIMGFENFIIVQSKIDVCSKERAQESYKEIKEFLKGSLLENAPIIPVSAHHGRNVDLLIQVINDILGFSSHSPRHSKQYADINAVDLNALNSYAHEVRDGKFATSKEAS